MTLSNYRGHQPVVIDDFNGLWDQNDDANVPLDHFQDCNNVRFVGKSFEVRPGINISQNVVAPLSNIRRIYNYVTSTGNTIIVLTYDYTADTGSIYHVVSPTSVFGPLLTKTGMKDFAFVAYNGRGYISPIGYFTMTALDGTTLNIEKGLQSEFLYVYAGDGTAARKAAGSALSGTLTIAAGAAGHTDAGLHLFGFVAETSSGALTPPGALGTFHTLPGNSVSFGNVPTSGSPTITKRHLVATKVITNYNGNTQGYQYFFVPNATINDNVTTFLNNISFYDSDLIDDASHLFDNYSEIPAGAVLSLYHDRLILGATFDDPNLLLASAVGEPEAINQIDGIIGVVPDGNPVTNAQELRDILYVFKRSKTTSYADNGDEPSTWLPVSIDDALGTSIHGIATVLDQGSKNVDFLIVCTYRGISLFVGKYIDPELTWKIYNFWANLDRNLFRNIQIINASIQKWILLVLPDNRVLYGDYNYGMDPKRIKWSPWTFDCTVNSLAIVNIDQIVVGADI